MEVYCEISAITSFKFHNSARRKQYPHDVTGEDNGRTNYEIILGAERETKSIHGKFYALRYHRR